VVPYFFLPLYFYLIYQTDNDIRANCMPFLWMAKKDDSEIIELVGWMHEAEMRWRIIE
jgi:hypothetical protein